MQVARDSMTTDSPKPRYAQNAPGDSYVERDLCIGCRLPEHVAPDLMDFAQGGGAGSHCYFKRQPATSSELGQALGAIRVACCGALRYGGNDPRIIRELARAGCRDACDQAVN